MKLNQRQKYALLSWLGSKMSDIYKDHSIIDNIDNFCNEEILEWRIIYKFGMAGKIWNTYDKIYITGYNQNEIGTRAYFKQQNLIAQWNAEIIDIIAQYEIT